MESLRDTVARLLTQNTQGMTPEITRQILSFARLRERLLFVVLGIGIDRPSLRLLVRTYAATLVGTVAIPLAASFQFEGPQDDVLL